MHQYKQVYTIIHRYTPVYTGIHIVIYTGIQQYTPVYTGIHRHTPMYIAAGIASYIHTHMQVDTSIM